MNQVMHLDSRALRTWVSRAVAAATDTAALVDSFNVFPLADLDTGSNVLLTLRGGAGALASLHHDADAPTTARVLADGAVRSARGNSGLLVSQVLVALADATAQAPQPRGLRPVELVAALEQASTAVWEAVSRPVAGTLLSVAQDAAQAARAIVTDVDVRHLPTLEEVAAAAALGAQESVVETAGLGHGPVDAGGAALMLVLTTLADALADLFQPDAAGAGGTYTPVAIQMLQDLAGSVSHSPTPPSPDQAQAASSGEFEVMYLLEATTAQATALRRRLETIGDSVGVVGTPDALGVGLFQVHVHTDAPRSALPRAGRARQVCVHHLHPTTPALTGAWDVAEPPLPASARQGNVVSLERVSSRAARAASSRAGAQPTAPAVGVVACTRAPGLMEQLARTGAVVVLDPTPEGVVRAVGDLAAPSVLVLPCDAPAADAAHEAGRYLTARSLPTQVAAPGAGSSPVPDRPAGARPPQLIVADTDDDARVLAAAVALAGRGPEEGVATLAAQAAVASAQVRSLALSGPQGEPEAVAAAVTAALRGEDRLVTLVLGRDALPDVAALTSAAVAGATAFHDGGGSGAASTFVLVGEDTEDEEAALGAHGGDEVSGVDVTVYAGGQARPDVLVAIQ